MARSANTPHARAAGCWRRNADFGTKRAQRSHDWMANLTPAELNQASADTRRDRPPCLGTASGDVGEGMVVSEGKPRLQARSRVAAVASAPSPRAATTQVPEDAPYDIRNDQFDIILIMHVDHEQNASTSIVRTAGPSGAKPFPCIASAEAAVPHD